MMRRIGLTQRVDVVPPHGERRDCLDQNWAPLLLRLKMVPVPIPNRLDDAAAYLSDMKLDGIILTGGNDLAHLAGAVLPAPERDRLEHHLLDSCSLVGIPVLGVCRGLQVINVHYGGEIRPVSGHVACRHGVRASPDACGAWPGEREVNSFHQFGIPAVDLAEPLEALAWDPSGAVEAVRHRTAPVYGIMWHPERERPYADYDLGLLQQVFGRRNV